MFRKTIGFRYTRRSLAVGLAFGWIWAGLLIAAPDPDIFDGRMQNASRSAGGGAGAASGAGAEAETAERKGSSGSTAESSGEPSAQAPSTGGAVSPGRDFGEIGVRSAKSARAVQRSPKIRSPLPDPAAPRAMEVRSSQKNRPVVAPQAALGVPAPMPGAPALASAGRRAILNRSGPSAPAE